MFSEDGYIGCPCGVESLRALNDKLNAEVVERINDTQELVMMSNYAVEADEFQFKKCVQERISEIASWHWVLSDLVTRLDDAMTTLLHEHKALRVVIQRVKDEISGFSRSKSKPGALCPLTDNVEDAIKKEYEFLKTQRTRFETLTPELDKQISALEKTKKKIEEDCVFKEQAISVEESCAKMDLRSATQIRGRKCTKNKVTHISQWEKRCQCLKNEGLRALTNAIVTRQQLRGSRVELSISAQSYAARVDSALRRRLHFNQVKAQELNWQKDEATRDLQALEEELTNTDKALLENMEQERIVEARIADRCKRPSGELTRDIVGRKLKDELMRIRKYNRELRANIERLTKLQRNLTSAITQFDCASDDIARVIKLDEERINARLGTVPEESLQAQPRVTASTTPASPVSSFTGCDNYSKNCYVPSPPSQESDSNIHTVPSSSQPSFEFNYMHESSTTNVFSSTSTGNSRASTPYETFSLNTIKEEDEDIEEEEDDYPFED